MALFSTIKQSVLYLTKRLLIIVTGFICLILLVIASLHLFLRTSQGQEWVSHQIEESLTQIDGLVISLESIKTTSPRTIRIEELRLYNKEKELALRAPFIELQISLMQLLKAKMPLTKILVPSLELDVEAIKKWDFLASSTAENFQLPSILLIGDAKVEIDHIVCVGSNPIIQGLKPDQLNPLSLYSHFIWNPLSLSFDLDLIEKKETGHQPQLHLSLYQGFKTCDLKIKFKQFHALSSMIAFPYGEFFKEFEDSEITFSAESKDLSLESFFPPELNYRLMMAGSHPAFSKNFNLDAYGTFELEDVALHQKWKILAPGFTGEGSLDWNPKEHLTANARVNLTSEEPSLFPLLKSQEIDLDLWLNTYNGLGKLSARAETFQYEKISAAKALNLNVNWLSPGHIFANAEATWLEQPFKTEFELHKLNSGEMELEKLQLTAPSLNLKLEAQNNHEWDLKARAGKAFLTPLGQEFNFQELSLSELVVDAKVSPKLKEALIEADFNLQIKEAAANQFKCQKLLAKGQGSIDLNHPNQSLLNSLLISCKQIRKNDQLLVDQIEGTLWGNPKAFFYNLHLTKEAQFEGIDSPFDLQSQGVVDLGLIDRIQDIETQRPFRIGIDTLSGSWAGLNASLLDPCIIVLSSQGTQIQNFQLDIGEGQWKGWAHISPEGLQLSSQMYEVPADLLQLLTGRTLLGEASGLIELDFRSNNCQAEVDLRLRHLRLAQADEVLIPVDGYLKVDWHHDKIAIAAKMSNINHFLACKLTGDLHPPSSLDKWRELNGELDLFLEGNLGLFSRLFISEELDFDGKVLSNLHFKGSGKEPIVSGEISIEEGSYDHYWIGLSLQNISAHLTGQGTKIILDYLKTSDMAGGSASAYGELSLLNETSSQSFIKANDLRFLNIPFVEATAQGECQFLHRGAKAQFKGELELKKVEIRVPEQLPSPVPQLDNYITVYDSELSGNAKKTAKSISLGIVELDLLAKLPKAVLKGRGLDTVWKGELHLKGDEVIPLVRGHIDLVNGEFEFADKRFLVKEGSLTFTENTTTESSIHMIAEARVDQITLRTILNGPLDKPRLQFRSTPNLSMADFFSYLLFSKPHSSLSGFQAFQVAQIAIEASGDSSLGIMSQLRKKTGIDRIELLTRDKLNLDDDSDFYTVKVGKYISDGFLVGLSKDVTDEGTQLTFELDLTKHLSLITEIGYLTNSSINLLWKKEY